MALDVIAETVSWINLTLAAALTCSGTLMVFRIKRYAPKISRIDVYICSALFLGVLATFSYVALSLDWLINERNSALSESVDLAWSLQELLLYCSIGLLQMFAHKQSQLAAQGWRLYNFLQEQIKDG